MEELSKNEIIRVVMNLKGKQPLTEKQREMLYELFTLVELAKIFHDEFQKSCRLTFYHYNILFSRFPLEVQDHPIEQTSYYEYGWQESLLCAGGKMQYIKFNNLIVLDYDGISYDELYRFLPCNILFFFLYFFFLIQEIGVSCYRIYFFDLQNI